MSLCSLLQAFELYRQCPIYCPNIQKTQMASTSLPSLFISTQLLQYISVMIVDHEQLQNINEHADTEARREQTSAVSSTSFGQQLQLILLKVQQRVKMVVFLILAVALASCWLIQSPPSLTPLPLPPQQPQHPALQTVFPLLNSTTTSYQDTSITDLTQNIKNQLNELIQEKTPTRTQLQQILEWLEKTKLQLQKKKTYHRQRLQFFSLKSTNPGLSYLAYQQFNIEEHLQASPQTQQQLKQKQWNQLEHSYQLSSIKGELPMCLFVYATQSRKPFATEYLLKSILRQNYTNYRVVISYDDLPGETLQNIKTTLHYQNSNKIQLIVNQQKLGYWNTLRKVVASQGCCGQAEVVALLTLNDQMLAHNVLATFNSVYQLKQANLVYSNNLELHQQSHQVFKGASARYTREQIVNLQFRNTDIKFGSLLTFRKSLFEHLQNDDLLPPGEQATQFHTQISLYIALLELSCGKVEYIPEPFYLFQGFKSPNNKDAFFTYMRAFKDMPQYHCYQVDQQN